MHMASKRSAAELDPPRRRRVVIDEDEEADDDGDEAPPKRPRVRAGGWLTASSVQELLGAEVCAETLARKQHSVTIEGEQVSLLAIQRKRAPGRVSWEDVAAALGMDWDRFVQEHYVATALYTYERDGKMHDATACIVYAGSLEEGRRAYVKLLRAQGRPRFLASLAEYVAPGYPVAAYFDIDYYHRGDSIDEGKAREATLKAFMAGWSKVRRVFLGADAPGVAVADSSRRISPDVYKVSLHVHDPAFCLDSVGTMKTLASYMQVVVLPDFKTTAAAGETHAIDISVYSLHRAFRSPLTTKFGGAMDTYMTPRQDPGRDLLSFFIVQPRDTPTIPLQALRDTLKIKNIPFAEWQRRRLTQPTPGGGEDETVGEFVADHINLLLGVRSTGRDWKVSRMEKKVGLYYRGLTCLCNTDIQHGSAYHSGILYDTASGDVYVTCSNPSHGAISLAEIPLAATPSLDERSSRGAVGRASGLKDELREKLGILFGKVDSNRVPDAQAQVMRTYLELAGGAAIWIVPVTEWCRIVLTEDPDQPMFKVEVSAYDQVRPLDPKRDISVYLQDNKPHTADPVVTRHLVADCFDVYTRPPPAPASSTVERLNLWVAQLVRGSSMYQCGDTIYCPSTAHPHLLENMGTIKTYIERAMEMAPPDIRADWMKVPERGAVQVWGKLEAVRGFIRPITKQDCYAYTNGVWYLPAFDGSEPSLTRWQEAFRPWADFANGDPAVLPIARFDTDWSPDFFTDRTTTPSFNAIMDLQWHPESDAGKWGVVMLGRFCCQKSLFLRGESDNWQKNVALGGEAGGGKSTITRGLAGAFADHYFLDRDRAAAIGGLYGIQSADVVVFDDPSGDPRHPVYRKFDVPFAKNWARLQPCRIDVLYEKKTIQTVIGAPGIVAYNAPRLGLEKVLTNYDDMHGYYRSFVWLPFTRAAPRKDGELPARIVKERGAFFMRSIWEYAKMRHEHTDIENVPFVREGIESRLKRNHIYGRYLDFCKHNSGNNSRLHKKPTSTSLLEPEGGVYVTSQDFLVAFRSWRNLPDQGEDPDWVQRAGDPQAEAGIFELCGFTVTRSQMWTCKMCGKVKKDGSPANLVLLGQGKCRHSGANCRGKNLRAGTILNAKVVTYGG